jgi:hypothetical protein
MRHFPQGPQLFDLTLRRRQGVLSWKMIACHHAKLHGTAGRFGCAFLELVSELR